MNHKYLLNFGISVLNNGVGVESIKDAELLLTNGETVKLPIYTILTDREKMHKFVDEFFNEIENS